MFTKYNTFINNSLFNHVGVDFAVYYDAKNNRFRACAIDAYVPEHYVQTPHDIEVNYPAMKKFWLSLDNDSRDLAQSFGDKHGFFQFMRDTGLIEYYDKAYAEAAEEVINEWEQDNHLNINWNSIITDW